MQFREHGDRLREAALIDALVREKRSRLLAETALYRQSVVGEVSSRDLWGAIVNRVTRSRLFRRFSKSGHPALEGPVQRTLNVPPVPASKNSSPHQPTPPHTPMMTSESVTVRSVSPGPHPTIEVDVCIVTTCSFPGGNASSSIEELSFFSRLGLRVVLINCPLTRGSRKVAARYEPFVDRIVHADDVKSVRSRVVIVRHPRVIMSDTFEHLATRIESDRTVFVVNNSAYRQTGDVVFEWDQLIARVEGFGCKEKSLHPIGPALREEALREGHAHALAQEDWSPTFHATQIPFLTRFMVGPIVIGRHGRDGVEKWLESKDELLLAYPEDANIFVKILGGAGKARKVLGEIPGNWIVYPFGSMNVSKFLSDIDAFVYFPHSNLNEAFGRTIIEAAFSGLPCILPPRFKTTFGELALYCEPADVRHVLQRLTRDDPRRGEFLAAVRDEAVARFESSALLRRLPNLLPDHQELYEQERQASLSPELLAYRHWIETGRPAR